jgi:hypothetical protein
LGWSLGGVAVWPFSKKIRQQLELPSDNEQRWSVAQAKHEGGPLLVRFNETAGEWAGHPDLPIKLGFAVALNRANEGALPDAAENEELLGIEDVIVRQVSSTVVGVHALTLTTGVMREWVFYVAPGADIAKLHHDIRSQVASHHVQCIAVEERKWESYRAFVP